jgi:hypothetical protein
VPLGPLGRCPRWASWCAFACWLALYGAAGVDAASANHSNTQLGAVDADCLLYTGHDAASGTTSDYQLTLLRLTMQRECRSQRWDFGAVTGTNTPTGTGKSLADLATLAGTGNTRLSDIKSKLDEIETWMDGGGTGTGWLEQIMNNTQPLVFKLNTLHDDLVAIKTSIDTLGTNVDPQYVQLASADVTDDLVTDATALTHANLWFIVGLFVAGLASYAIARAVFPR